MRAIYSFSSKVLLYILLFVSLTVSGCSAFRGAPKSMINYDAEIKRLDKYFNPEVQAEYEKINPSTDPQKAKIARNEIINGRLRVYDLQYSRFKSDLYKEGVGSNIGVDGAVITMGAIGALSSGGTSKTLSGITAGVTGIKGSVDKNLFYEKTMPALLVEMDGQRLQVLARIRQGQKESVTDYPLLEALADVDSYFDAGTIYGAIDGVLKSAGDKKNEAESVILGVKGKSYFEKEAQDRVSNLVEKISALDDAKAIALDSAPPVASAEADKVIALRDPTGQRKKDGKVAKEMLKMRVVFSERASKELDAWEAAVKAAAK